MPRGSSVNIMGVVLRREGDHIVVLVEDEHGREVEVIRELADGPISHHVTEHGIRSRMLAAGH